MPNKEKISSSISSELSNSPFSTGNVKVSLMEDDSRSDASFNEENKFLGNNILESKPDKVGQIKVLCYSNQVPIITIGPDCKCIFI
jgi:hypothetical protein